MEPAIVAGSVLFSCSQSPAIASENLFASVDSGFFGRYDAKTES